MITQFEKPNTEILSRCGRVAVLLGGTAAEREVSLNSGRMVFEALQQAGIDAVAVDIGSDPISQLQKLKVDHVLNILHGRVGEDGEIQAIMNRLGIPYLGSEVLASAVTMDKLMCKRLLIGSDLPTPDYRELNNQQQAEQAMQALGLPLVIKPVYEGSSIGLSIVRKAQDLAGAFELAKTYGTVMAEQFINGPEYTVAVLDGQALPAIRVSTPRDFYDYTAKYEADNTGYECPCDLDQSALKKLNEVIERTAEICQIRHWGRIDTLLDEQGKFQVIDINTIPGMTDHSLVPKAASVAGLDYQQLVLKLLELTIRDAAPVNEKSAEPG